MRPGGARLRPAKAYIGSASELNLEKAFPAAGLGPADRFPVARDLGDPPSAIRRSATRRSTQNRGRVPAD